MDGVFVVVLVLVCEADLLLSSRYRVVGVWELDGQAYCSWVC